MQNRSVYRQMTATSAMSVTSMQPGGPYINNLEAVEWEKDFLLERARYLYRDDTVITSRMPPKRNDQEGYTSVEIALFREMLNNERKRVGRKVASLLKQRLLAQAQQMGLLTGCNQTTGKMDEIKDALRLLPEEEALQKCWDLQYKTFPEGQGPRGEDMWMRPIEEAYMQERKITYIPGSHGSGGTDREVKSSIRKIINLKKNDIRKNIREAVAGYFQKQVKKRLDNRDVNVNGKKVRTESSESFDPERHAVAKTGGNGARNKKQKVIVDQVRITRNDSGVG